MSSAEGSVPSTEGIAAAPNAGARGIWARLTVDPLAVPLSRRLARVRGVTPNRVTAFSAALAVGAAACFATGHLRVGGLLFILRFFFDCMDGQVARFQRASSKTGAAFDIIVDVVGISLCLAALCWNLISDGSVPDAVALGLIATVIVYNWSLAYRKGVAAADVEGDGGTGGQLTVPVPGLGPWVRFCRRIGMSPLPWSVEAEIAALGLGPLLLPRDWVVIGLVVALVFYLFASAVNVRRILRLSRDLDLAGAPSAAHPDRKAST